MVLQALADPGGVGDRLDAVGPQVVGGADARQQQQLGAVDRAAARSTSRPARASCSTPRRR
jgi:hypothetical protein